MKPFAISRSSWHFRFVQKFGNQFKVYEMLHDKSATPNTCQYLNLFLGALTSVAVGALLAVALVSLLVIYPTICVGQAAGWWELLEPRAVAAGLLMFTVYLFGLFVYGLLRVAAPIFERIREKRRYKDEGSLTELVELKQSKICVPVVFKE